MATNTITGNLCIGGEARTVVTADQLTTDSGEEKKSTSTKVTQQQEDDSPSSTSSSSSSSRAPSPPPSPSGCEEHFPCEDCEKWANPKNNYCCRRHGEVYYCRDEFVMGSYCFLLLFCLIGGFLIMGKQRVMWEKESSERLNLTLKAHEDFKLVCEQEKTQLKHRIATLSETLNSTQFLFNNSMQNFYKTVRMMNAAAEPCTLAPFRLCAGRDFAVKKLHNDYYDLIIQDDYNLVLYSDMRRALWASGTYKIGMPRPSQMWLDTKQGLMIQTADSNESVCFQSYFPTAPSTVKPSFYISMELQIPGWIRFNTDIGVIQATI